MPARYTSNNEAAAVTSTNQTEEDDIRHASLRNRMTAKMMRGARVSSSSGTRSEDRLTYSSRGALSKISEKGQRGTHKNSNNLMLIESNKDSKISLNSRSASSYTVTNSTAIKPYI